MCHLLGQSRGLSQLSGLLGQGLSYCYRCDRRGLLHISSAVTVRLRCRSNNERYTFSVPLFFSLAGWLSLVIKELLEGAVHNLGDAYPFKIGCALDCFDVSLLYVVGFALGLLLRVIFHLHS